MCTALSLELYCKNFKCPHNLFWEELSLDRDKIQMTDKAFEIRNCCCKIIYPWTPEEISDAWGITRETIRRSEEAAFRKLQKKIRINRKRPLYKSTVHRRLVESSIHQKQECIEKRKGNCRVSTYLWVGNVDSANVKRFFAGDEPFGRKYQHMDTKLSGICH